MTAKIKTLLVASLACVCGSLITLLVLDPPVGDRSVPMTGGISVEPRNQNFILPESCTY